MSLLKNLLEWNAINVQQMQQINGYDIIARIMRRKEWILDEEMLAIIFEFVGLSKSKKRGVRVNHSKDIAQIEVLTMCGSFYRLIQKEWWRILKQCKVGCWIGKFGREHRTMLEVSFTKHVNYRHLHQAKSPNSYYFSLWQRQLPPQTSMPISMFFNFV